MKIEDAIFYLKNTPVIASNANKETVQKAYDMAIEALERKKGKWIDDGDPLTFKCDKCGYLVARYNNTNFCPNCGSYNGGEQDE